jgi:hypothetical protein
MFTVVPALANVLVVLLAPYKELLLLIVSMILLASLLFLVSLLTAFPAC